MDDKTIRALHERRMRAWGVRDDQEYANEVVARVQAALRGEDDEPFLHEHAINEMGACLECDAAAVLSELGDNAR